MIFDKNKETKKQSTKKSSATKKESKSLKPNTSQKCRLLKNPNQTATVQTYYVFGTDAINIHKQGYYFSMDKEMDKTIEYLKKELGFIEVK